MITYLCEKPSQARDIAAVLGANVLGEGYISSSTIYVTWCFGHLLEMAPPDAYDPALKKWSVESLPILPQEWKINIKKKCSKQIKVISNLLKKSDEVIIATDADREGEVIAREVLDYLSYKGEIKRLWLSSLDEKSIKTALEKIKPGSETLNLYYAGLARGRADWMVGMNLTRLFTCLGKEKGHEGVYSVGRVQTPTLKLVFDRDLEINNFKSHDFYDFYLLCKTAKGESLKLKWKTNEAFLNAENFDAETRCINKPFLEQVVLDFPEDLRINVDLYNTARKKQAAPLLYSLSDLQQEASKKYSMDVQQVLDIAQTLYEKHKLTSYPRTDCNYMPLSQFDEAERVIDALQANDPRIESLCSKTKIDLRQKSKVWNDVKITAHHAIVPTSKKGNIDNLSDAETKIYDLIRRRYLAQFYSDYIYNETNLKCFSEKGTLSAKGITVIDIGWKELLSTRADGNNAIPKLQKGDGLIAMSTDITNSMTKPPSPYTQGTLIAAMKNIARNVTNPEIKKRLQENAGIGTEATRANIIKLLIDRHILIKNKKFVITSDQGKALISVLPEAVMDPATTAMWEQSLEAIANKTVSMEQFLESQANWVAAVVKQTQSNNKFIVLEKQLFSCPECSKPLVRRKGVKGFFWGCSDYPTCKTTLPDKRQQPVFSKKAKKINNEQMNVGQTCPKCNKGKLFKNTFKEGKHQGNAFIGCSNFPKCRFLQF